MLGTVRIQGGDATATNTAGGVWAIATQFTTVPSFLTKLVVFVPTALATRLIWIFDTATGSAGSVDVMTVLACPNGFTTTLDFGDYGKIFKNGIYIVVATNEPGGPGDSPTGGSEGDARIAIDYKVK